MNISENTGDDFVDTFVEEISVTFEDYEGTDMRTVHCQMCVFIGIALLKSVSPQIQCTRQKRDKNYQSCSIEQFWNY